MVDYSSMQRWGVPAPFDPPTYGGLMGGGTSAPTPIFGGGANPDGTMSLNPTNMSSALGSNFSLAGGGTPKLGLNFDTANLALSGIGTLGGLWAAFKAQQLARDQFNYTKSITNTNLANQIQTYNTALTDRGNNRAIVEGKTPDQTKAYIDANSLKKWGG